MVLDVSDQTWGSANITIISMGAWQKDSVMQSLRQLLKDAGRRDEDIAAELCIIDLRTILKKDPQQDGAATKKDYRDIHTVATVMQNPSFASAVTKVVSKAYGCDPECEGACNVLALVCQTGYHRASVTGKVSEGIMNATIVDENAGPRRAFNAQFFPVHHIPDETGKKNVEKTLKRAITWLDQPWVAQPLVQHEKDLFGFSQSSQTPESAETWLELMNMARDLFFITTSDDRLQIALQEGESVEMGGADTADAANEPEETPISSKRRVPPVAPIRDSFKEQVQKTITKKSATTSVPREPRAHVKLSGSAAKETAYNRLMRIREKVGAPPNAEPEHDDRPSDDSSDQWGNWDSAQHEAQAKEPAASADAHPPSLPPWISFSQSPEVWYSELKTIGCDDTSIKELFCLAQVSDDGRLSANQIIAKFLKKQADGEELRKPSALLHTCVKNARHDMFPKHESGSWGPSHSWKGWKDSSARDPSSGSDSRAPWH